MAVTLLHAKSEQHNFTCCVGQLYARVSGLDAGGSADVGRSVVVGVSAYAGGSEDVGVTADVGGSAGSRM